MILHKGKPKAARKEHSDGFKTTCTLVCHNPSRGGVSCSKIVLTDVLSENLAQMPYHAYAIVDDQSNPSMISPNLQSWTKVLGQMCTCGSLQTRKTKSRATFNQHEPNPSPHPTYNVENTYPQLFLTFNIVLGGGGGNCRRSAQIFDNYGFYITVPRYFVQDCSKQVGCKRPVLEVLLVNVWRGEKREVRATDFWCYAAFHGWKNIKVTSAHRVH